MDAVRAAGAAGAAAVAANRANWFVVGEGIERRGGEARRVASTPSRRGAAGEEGNRRRERSHRDANVGDALYSTTITTPSCSRAALEPQISRIFAPRRTCASSFGVTRVRDVGRHDVDAPAGVVLRRIARRAPVLARVVPPSRRGVRSGWDASAAQGPRLAPAPSSAPSSTRRIEAARSRQGDVARGHRGHPARRRRVGGGRRGGGGGGVGARAPQPQSAPLASPW